MLNHQEKANQNDFEIPLYTYQNGYMKNTDDSLC